MESEAPLNKPPQAMGCDPAERVPRARAFLLSAWGITECSLPGQAKLQDFMYNARLCTKRNALCKLRARVRVLSSVGRAEPLQGLGRGFESLSTHHHAACSVGSFFLSLQFVQTIEKANLVRLFLCILTAPNLLLRCIPGGRRQCSIWYATTNAGCCFWC